MEKISRARKTFALSRTDGLRPLGCQPKIIGRGTGNNSYHVAAVRSCYLKNRTPFSTAATRRIVNV
jgi:hypothetical protein